MCRFPGLITAAGLLLVIGAALLGLTPAAEVSASPEPARVVQRADRTFDNFLPPLLFAESSRTTREKIGQSASFPRMAKQPLSEVAMMGECVENGPPFRR